MNEKLPIKEEKSLFGKIKNFFRNLFYKPVQIENEDCVENTDSETMEIKEKNVDSFINDIKIEVDNSVSQDLERNELFEKIRKNPELLDTLNSKQLENLSKYYDKVIQKNNEIIEKKKAQLKKVS